jgi:hypothetical protein
MGNGGLKGFVLNGPENALFVRILPCRGATNLVTLALEAV